MLETLIFCASVLVHDGDTFHCDGVKIRLHRWDTSELPGSPSCMTPARRTRSWCDYAKGIEARDALRSHVRGRVVSVRYTGDRSFDRMVADVYVDGAPLGPWLAARGLARLARLKR